jgi:hypothetical protein
MRRKKIKEVKSMMRNEKRESKMWRGSKILSEWSEKMIKLSLNIKDNCDLVLNKINNKEIYKNLIELRNTFNKKNTIINLLEEFDLPQELVKKIQNYYVNKLETLLNKMFESYNNKDFGKLEGYRYDFSMILLNNTLRPVIDKDIKILDNNKLRTIKAKDSVYTFSYSIGEGIDEQHYTYIYDRNGKLLQKSRPLVSNRFFNKNRVVRITGKQVIPYYDEEEDEMEYETRDFQSRYIRFENHFDLPATFGMMYDLIKNKFVSTDKKFNKINYNELKELNLLKR